MKKMTILAVILVLVMALTIKSDYFVLYGLCAEVSAEAIAKYIYICRWMKRAPVGVLAYAGWWLLPAAAIAAAYLLRVNDSFWMMALLAGFTFAVGGIRELNDPENTFLKHRKGMKPHGKT